MSEPPTPPKVEKLKTALSATAKANVTSALVYAAGNVIGGLLSGRPRTVASEPEKGSVEYWTHKFQSSRFFAPLIFGSIVIIGLGSLYDSLEKLGIIWLLKWAWSKLQALV